MVLRVVGGIVGGVCGCGGVVVEGVGEVGSMYVDAFCRKRWIIT